MCLHSNESQIMCHFNEPHIRTFACHSNIPLFLMIHFFIFDFCSINAPPFIFTPSLLLPPPFLLLFFLLLPACSLAPPPPVTGADPKYLQAKIIQQEKQARELAMREEQQKLLLISKLQIKHDAASCVKAWCRSKLWRCVCVSLSHSLAFYFCCTCTRARSLSFSLFNPNTPLLL